MMDATQLVTGGMQILVVLLGVTVHESAHAFAARRLGDPTAAMLGRASLNPLRHLDPIGTVLVPILLVIAGLPAFGWGRPTPVLLHNFSRPRRDDMLVTAAGVCANAFLAVAATCLLPLAVAALGPQARQAGDLVLIRQVQQAGALAGFPVVFTLVQVVYVNALLVCFNLIPVPPFDGGQLVLHLMPADWAPAYSGLRRFGFGLGLFLAFAGMALQIVYLLLLPFTLVMNLLLHLTG